MAPSFLVLLSLLTLQVLSQQCKDGCMSITGEIPSELKVQIFYLVSGYLANIFKSRIISTEVQISMFMIVLNPET